MTIDDPDANPHARRRSALAARLGTRPALIASGSARPRNYTANTYPFRASSHFLYLFGLAAERDGFAFYDGATWALYLPPRDPDDALWEGPRPSFAEIADSTGCAVHGLSELDRALGGRDVATLPAPDLETCEVQSRWLGRDVRPRHFTAADEALAEAMIALRLHHDDAAVAELRLAAAATDAAHRAGMRATRPGLRESSVRAAMEAEILARDLHRRLRIDRHHPRRGVAQRATPSARSAPAT